MLQPGMRLLKTWPCLAVVLFGVGTVQAESPRPKVRAITAFITIDR